MFLRADSGERVSSFTPGRVPNRTASLPGKKIKSFSLSGGVQGKSLCFSDGICGKKPFSFL